ncbi:MAG: hypothetical protein AAGA83_03610 [Cyanobacteria bacterium P01_F01_bin.116]
MSAPLSYVNTLHMSPYGKSIPYPESGETNHGFKNLKNSPDLIDSIPELSTDDGLKSLVKSLNTQESSFFSIGCFSEIRKTLHGLRRQGYVEFAWNCTNCVQDAIHYFSLFFHFEQFLRTQGFNHKVKLDWIIEEAQFCDIDLCGFCCAIFIDTAPCQLAADAAIAWQTSLQTIELFLNAIPRSSSSVIYMDTGLELREVTA